MVQTGSGILVCFAVKEEAAPFRPLVANRPDIKVVVTGMGANNAKVGFEQALQEHKPASVLTCGYAGGLNPTIAPESIVFDSTPDFSLTEKLVLAGATRGTFHCATKVATTVGEKTVLFTQTKQDAVEMESGIIRHICRERGIPAATVRVISDAAQETLPLDFNQLMTPEMNMDFGKLALTLLKSPGKIPALIRFGNRTKSSAEKLAHCLARTLEITK